MVGSMATSQAICLRRILKRILEDIGDKQNETTTLFCENKSAIFMAKNSVYHNRIKHIGIKHHLIK